MQSYINSHPPSDAVQRRRIVSAFLDKFARPDQIDVALDMPDWTEDMVALMTQEYDTDVSRIMAMEGVRVIAP